MNLGWARRAVPAAVVAAVVTGGVFWAISGRHSPAPTAPPGSDYIATAPVAADVAPPQRLRIPAIDVDTTLTTLTTDQTGALVPPAGPDIVGWYTGGPVPGAVGPAVLAGHVDSRAGPGVFFRLRDLRPGDRIEVERGDGSWSAFTVTGSVRTPKAAFPTDAVYAPTPGPELRLVTCGGTFDAAARSYRDNVVVDAVPSDTPVWGIAD